MGRPGGLGRRKRLRPSRKLRLLRLWGPLLAQSGCGGGRDQSRRPNKATSSSLSRITWLGPLPQIFTGAREKQRVTTARGSPLLRPSAQLAVCGGAGVLPVWQDCGVGREQNPGRRASVVPPGASRGFPSVVPLVCPLSPPTSLLRGGCGQVPAVAGPATLGAGWSELLLRSPPVPPR